MPKIAVQKGDERIFIEADIHNGYLVIPETKIPYIDEDKLPDNKELKQKILDKIEVAKKDPEALKELWIDGEVLGYTYERTLDSFSYGTFLRKFQNMDFINEPIEKSLSPLEREHFLHEISFDDFKSQPEVIMGIIRSLSSERLDIVLIGNNTRDKITEFFVSHGTPEDIKELFSLSYNNTLRSIRNNDYALLLNANVSNKKENALAITEEIAKFTKQSIPENIPLWVLQQRLDKDDESGYGINTHKNFTEKVYLEMLPITLAACKSEGNTGAVEHAYKLATLFDKTSIAMDYVDKWTNSKRSDSRQPLHDILLFNIPENGDEYNKTVWRKLALEHGPEVLKYFGNAPALERALKDINEINVKENKPVLELEKLRPKDFKNISETIKFLNFTENKELATLCASLGISERVFEKGLEILRNPKTQDNMPDIGIIDGKEFGQDAFYMRKLDTLDPRNLLIGKIVDCCNHIANGVTEDMAIAHVQSPDAACYVIFKKEKKIETEINGKKIKEFTITPELDQPVAKLTGWMSRKNNFVFNSWERLGEYSNLCEPFVTAAANKILDENEKIEKVLLGRNRDTVEKYTKVSNPEIARDFKCSSDDADTQYLVDSRKLYKTLTVSSTSENPEKLWNLVIEEIDYCNIDNTENAEELKTRLKEVKPQINLLQKITELAKELGVENFNESDFDSSNDFNILQEKFEDTLKSIREFTKKNNLVFSNKDENLRDLSSYFTKLSINDTFEPICGENRLSDLYPKFFTDIVYRHTTPERNILTSLSQNFIKNCRQEYFKERVFTEFHELLNDKSFSPNQQKNLNKFYKENFAKPFEGLFNFAYKTRGEIIGGANIKQAASDFAKETEAILEIVLNDRQDKIYYSNYSSVFLGKVVNNLFGDLVGQTTIQYHNDYHHFLTEHDNVGIYTNETKDKQLGIIGHFAGKTTLWEDIKKNPKGTTKQTATSIGLILLLALGVKTKIKSNQEHLAKEKPKIETEAKNNSIFRQVNLNTAAFKASLEDVDISNLPEMKKKFGDSIEISDGYKIPTTIFVEQVAPALNTIEELQKKTQPDKWNFKKSGSYQEKIDTAKTEITNKTKGK